MSERVSTDGPTLNFVISAPRSGSTWLATMLDMHPQIAAVEQRLFGSFHEIWLDRNGQQKPRFTMDSVAASMARHWLMPTRQSDRLEITQDLMNAMIDSLTQLAWRRTGKPILVDKVTPYAGTCRRVLGQMHRYRPHAKLVHLTRDGRDVVTSYVFDWMHRESDESPRKRFFFGHDQNVELDRFFCDEDVLRWGSHWNEVEGHVQRIRSRHSIRYESLKLDAVQSLSELLRFLGADDNQSLVTSICQATTIEKMASQMPSQLMPASKIRKGVVGDWVNYFTRRDGELFESVAPGRLRLLGYVSSDRWWESCPEGLDWA